ncbi:MAG TPA: cyclodeaminase/cyclohydrolase family protein [Polyangiales bacterium]|nr:cyclodeaminase/cyclohydrolase family protein [Polyangiales bacterium]
MSESIWELSLQSALDQTASAAPTPGGGSIAAVSASFGLGLVIMALEVSAKKQPAAAASVVKGRNLLALLTPFVDRDVAVFGAYMEALRLPKQTEAEQATRDAARAAASLEAARTPLQAAEACLRALSFAHSSARNVHKNVWSDLLAGSDLLMGSLKAVLRTVDINLPMVQDEAARQAMTERAAHLEHEATLVYQRIAGLEPTT